MTVLDDGFPARAGRSVENFSFFTTSENPRVAVPVQTQVCLAHSAVSNYDHQQVPREVEEESECMWCFPTSSWFRQCGLFSNPQQVSLAGILCGTCGNVRGVTTSHLVYEELPCGHPELCALSVLNLY